MKISLQTKSLWGRRQGVRLVRTRRADHAPHSINVPKISSGKMSTWMEGEKRYAWRNIITKSMLTFPKYAHKAAIFMKNTGLLGQFKARDRKVENRT